MQIRAAVMDKQGRQAPFTQSRPFKIEEIDLAGPEDGEVLVEIRAAGLCHSDLTTVEGVRPRPLPIVGGHEGAGVVVGLGPNVSSLAIGDHVVLTAASGCGRCLECGLGRSALCDTAPRLRHDGTLPGGGRRFSRRGIRLFHYSGVSSFSQYTVAAVTSMVRIDPACSLDVAAVFGCAVLTGAGAIFNAAQARQGQSVAVIGLGGVGLNAVMAAKAAGCSSILGIDINQDKFPLAQELGCQHTFLADDPALVSNVRDVTGGGVDIAVEVSGQQSGLDAAVSMARRGGLIVCVGISGYGSRYLFSHTGLVGDEKTIRGSLLGSGNAQRDIPRYVAMFTEGRLPVDRLISERIGLDDLNVALDRLKQGKAVRQIIRPNG